MPDGSSALWKPTGATRMEVASHVRTGLVLLVYPGHHLYSPGVHGGHRDLPQGSLGPRPGRLLHPDPVADRGDPAREAGLVVPDLNSITRPRAGPGPASASPRRSR